MEQLHPWLPSLIILTGAALAGPLLKWLIVQRLKAFFAKTETKLDDVFIAAVEGHISLWILLAGLASAATASPLDPGRQALVQKVVVAGFFVSVTLSLSKFISGLIGAFSPRLITSAAAAHMLENLSRVVVVGMGLMLLLSNLGISITPILTALGVGSLAVALALQDTLSNLFSGVHIVASRMLEEGDFVQLDSGQKGYVVNVGWRATRIRELSNNVVIVPNAKLSQAIITNYHRPEKELAVLVQVGVAYGSDLEKVERVTVEVARDVQKTVAGAVPGFEPFIRYNALADSSINFTAVLRGKEYTDQYLMTHEFMKRLHARYNKEGIEIPFPQRVVHLQQPK